MKKTLLILALGSMVSYSYGQNHFPDNGKVGIGTTTPQFDVEINGETPYLKISSSVYSNNPSVLTIKGGIIFNQEYGDKTAAILEAVPPGYHVPGILFSTKTAWNIPGPGSTDWYYRMFIHPNGNVGIGTTTPDARLAVNGTIHAQGVRVDMNGWADYVFQPNYKLRPLSEVQNYIDQHHHLPEMPSEKEVARTGIELGEMNRLLVKKMEELTLYLIEKDRQLNLLQKEVELLKQQQDNSK